MTGKRSLGDGTHRENMVSHMNERKGKRTTKLRSACFFMTVSKCGNSKTGQESYFHRLMAFRKFKHALSFTWSLFSFKKSMWIN
jgi:hypothetical protein